MAAYQETAFYKLHFLQQEALKLKASGDLAGYLDCCRKGLHLMPQWFAERRSGPEKTTSKLLRLWPLEDVAMYCPVLREASTLNFALQLIAQCPELVEFRHLFRQAVKLESACDSLLNFIRLHPGVLQSEFCVMHPDTKMFLWAAEKLQRIERIKKGRSFELRFLK